MFSNTASAVPQFWSPKNNIKGIIFRLSFTLINNKPINLLRKHQFLKHSLHDTHLGLPVRHLEFEKEAAAHHSYSQLKGLSRRSCTCFTHVLHARASRTCFTHVLHSRASRTCFTHVLHARASLACLHQLKGPEAVNQRDIFGLRDIFGPKFTPRSKLLPKNIASLENIASC